MMTRAKVVSRKMVPWVGSLRGGLARSCARSGWAADVKKVRLQGFAWEVCPPGVRWADVCDYCDYTEYGRERSGAANVCANSGVCDTERGQDAHAQILPTGRQWERGGAPEAEGT